MLPRPDLLAVQVVERKTNAHGLYNFDHIGFQPWYKPSTFWSKWKPSSLFLQLLGAKKPGYKGDRYMPQGYDLNTIGPAPQEGKGLEDMQATVAYMKSRGIAECPFAGMKKRSVN